MFFEKTQVKPTKGKTNLTRPESSNLRPKRAETGSRQQDRIPENPQVFTGVRNYGCGWIKGVTAILSFDRPMVNLGGNVQELYQSWS